ncbi:histamine N-methyltransferase-like [Glandiceps talaboti]
MTIEEYMSVSEDEMFDCIVGINFLYYVCDPDEIVRWLYSKLNDGGTLIFLVTSVNNIFPVLWANFPVLLSTRARKITPELIEASLKRSNAKDIKVIALEADIDVTECFVEDSNEGNLLLDFMTHAVRFRTTAPPILVRDVLQFMSEMGVTPSCSWRRTFDSMAQVACIPTSEKLSFLISKYTKGEPEISFKYPLV